MRIFNRAIRVGLSLMLAAGFISACSGDIPDDPSKKSLYTLSVTVINRTAATRSANHEKEDGTAAERAVDILGSDFRVMLFSESGNYITTLDPANLNITEKVEGNSTLYTITGGIDKQMAERSELKSKFQVMVLANWKGYDSNGAYPASSVSALPSIWSDGTSYNFSIQQSGGSSWTPDGKRKFIPMFGIASVDQAGGFREPDKVTGESHVSVTVPMLRALAKVEIALPESGLYLIGRAQPVALDLASATLSHRNANGRFIPNVAANPGWSDNDTQVTTVSLPAGSALPVAAGMSFVKVGNEYWAYIPEMTLQGTIEDESRPHLNITITGQNYNKDFRLDFCRYDGVPVSGSEFTQILRNHIYRFTVNSVTENQPTILNLQIGVCPWEQETIDIPPFQ